MTNCKEMDGDQSFSISPDIPLMSSRDIKTVPYEDALAQAGYGKIQWLVTIAGAMCILCSYVAVSSISFVLPSSQCDLQLTSQGKGTLIAFGFVGIIIGSHLWGYLSDTLGRRCILTRCLLADGILYICTSFVPNYWLFLIMRLLNGFSSCGAVVPAWAYIGEFHTDRHRTPAIMVASIIGVSIYIWLPCLAWVVLPLPVEVPLFSGLVFKSWRLFYLLCGIPSLLTFLLMLILPESPKFLLAKGKKEDCIKVLQYVYSKNTGKPPEELLIPNVTIDDNEKIAQSDGSPDNIKVFFQNMWIQTVPLFKKPLRFNFFILCTMQFIIYFCNNGMFLWVPETVNRIAIFRESNTDKESTFCLAVENYQSVSKDNIIMTTTSNYNLTEALLFDSIKTKEDTTTECSDSIDFTVYKGTIVIGAFAVIGLIVMIFLMKLFSRKFVLGCFLVTSFIMIILLIMLSELDLVFIMISTMLVCTGSAIPVVTSAVVDHFPTNLRAMAVCLTLMTGRIGTIVASQIVGTVLDTHCSIFLYCFAVLLAFCTLLVTFLPQSSKSDNKKTDSIEKYRNRELNQKSTV